MKYTPFIILIIIVLIYFSCKNKTSTSIDNMNLKVLKKEIINTGKVSSYKLLSMYYGDKKMDADFLDISIMMYKKHHYIGALSNIYDAFIYKNNPEVLFSKGNKPELLKKVPLKEQEIALKYLEIGVEKGDYACIENLSEYYLNIGKIDKSKELLKLQKNLIKNNIKKVNDSLSKFKNIKK